LARSRFRKDTGLTVRMTTVMFVLGALFVALVVVLMTVFSRYAVLIGLVGLAFAWGQWYFSDTLAMRAMRAHEVSPEEDPELHGIVDRLCGSRWPSSTCRTRSRPAGRRGGPSSA
jgi:heat shock protein HtpX